MWWPRWLRRKQPAQQETDLIERLNSNIRDEFKENQRSLRRLSIAQMKSLDESEKILKTLESFRAEYLTQSGFMVTPMEILDILDDLDKLASTLDPENHVSATITSNLCARLEAKFELSPIAATGEIYPEESCQVAAAVADNDYPPGTVLEIIEQGYLIASEKVLRPAKVVVAKAASPHNEDSL